MKNEKTYCVANARCEKCNALIGLSMAQMFGEETEVKSLNKKMVYFYRGERLGDAHNLSLCKKCFEVKSK